MSLHYSKRTQLTMLQPVESKSAPSLPTLVSLSVLPFTLLDPASPQYSESLVSFFAGILTVPLLPNRLPLPALTFLAPRIPLQHLAAALAPPILAQLPADAPRIDLLANLAAFAPPRYTALPAPAPYRHQGRRPLRSADNTRHGASARVRSAFLIAV